MRDRAFELIDVVADAVDCDTHARVAEIRLDDEREFERQADERRVLGHDREGRGYRYVELGGDTSDERLVVAIGQTLRIAAGVADAEYLQQGRDVQLFRRLVIETFIAKIEHEIDLFRVPAQMLDQARVIVHETEFVLVETRQGLLQLRDRMEIVLVELRD